MTTTDSNEWLRAVREDLVELAGQDFGYPLGINELREPQSSRTATVPPHLDRLYSLCDGMSLPDVHVGYFLDAASRTASAAQRGEPTVVVRESEFPVHVFGSDGGGGRFALALHDGSVYYLPASGAISAGRFIEDGAAPARVLAASVSEFLDRLQKDVRAFVRGDDGHKYMVS